MQTHMVRQLFPSPVSSLAPGVPHLTQHWVPAQQPTNLHQCQASPASGTVSPRVSPGEKCPPDPDSSTTSPPATLGKSNSTLGWAALEAPAVLDCGGPGEEDDAQVGKLFREEMS